jgi:hypothetical protein
MKDIAGQSCSHEGPSDWLMLDRWAIPVMTQPHYFCFAGGLAGNF